MSHNRTSYSNRPKVGVFAGLTAASNTTITTASTFYPIVGTFTNVPMQGFSFTVDPAIRLDNGNGFYEIVWGGSFQGDSNGMKIHVGVSINGETITTAHVSAVCTFLKIANESQAMGGVYVTELAQGDIVQLQITADNDGDVVTINHFTTTIKKFF